MRAYLGYCVIAICSLFLTACGGGGNEKTPTAEGEAAPVSTEFRITIDTPPNLTTAKHSSAAGIISKAYAEAQINLTENNFAAVWLDSKGKILEQIDITSWENQGNGLYIIKAGTKARLNAVLLIDLLSTPTFTIGEAIPTNLYMVPLADERLNLSLKSTLAYYAVTQRVQLDESWGVFEEAVQSASRGKVFFALQDIYEIADDFEVTLIPKLGLDNIRLSDLLSLSIVQSMTKGRMERFVTEQTAARADIAAILNDGYWRLSSSSSNEGSSILVDKMEYDGQETKKTEYRWDKNGDSDISLTEFFTYLSGSTAFGSDDVKRQILTNNGWIGLFDYLKVELSTPETTLLTDAALDIDDKVGITLEANFYPLTDKRMHDFLSGKKEHFITRYLPQDEVFQEGAFGFYFTWRPENETYLLCDNRNGNPACRVSPVALPGTFYTALDDILTPSDSIAVNIEGVNGFRIADNVIVEMINDNQFGLRYWVNIAANNWAVQEVSAWAPTQFAGKTIFRFDVPDVIKQIAINYQFEQQHLFLVEDRDFVNIGETWLDNEVFHFTGFDNNAKQQIFAVASRDNLPPFGGCAFGNTAQANESQYLNAVTECGGDERFTDQSVNNLINQHLVQISEEGVFTTIILRSNNSWELYNNAQQVSGNRTWTLTEEGYLKLVPNTAQPNDFDYWALTAMDHSLGVMAIKAYSSREENSNTSGNLIFTLIAKEYAPDQLAACQDLDSGWDQATTTPITKRTLSEYQQQVTLCKVVWEQRVPRFTEALLIGQTGELSDDKALQFAADSSRFLKLSDNFSGDFFLGKYIDSDGCGFNFDILWRLEEDGTLYYEAADGSMNERITMTDSDGLRFAIKAFNHQTRWEADETLLFTSEEGEMWSDVVSLIDASSVPNVVPTEAPGNPEPPADGEHQGPPAGTILNDGQSCAF
ncbi:hydrogenase expression protein HypA [uncultured Photobacterium sp.]|uniref:hydrogenase expression protein HypA n=1 Tax=uncultured Photobacterium sp. TaxID=173973 RepID=UPI002615A8A3|nr:hydrogenase expression protein HypA [uncultured Photobacterium sp.]